MRRGERRPREGEVALDDLIDASLNAPAHRLRLRFAPALERRFEADTGADRCRSLAVAGTFGFLFACVLYPVIISGMPDMAGMARLYYLGLSMPLGFATSLLLWLCPRPVIRESLVLVANLVCITVIFAMMSQSRFVFEPLAVAGVASLMVYSALGIQLRFVFAVIALAAITGEYAWVLQNKPDVSPPEQIDLIVVTGVTGAYLLLGNWRMERALRRSYLLVLRERLQRQDLSLRNLELDELARRDPLTGLANRRAYDAWLASAWAAEASPDVAGAGELGLVVLDVDRFKAYNDFYGHAAGDQCLKSIALALRDQLRGTTDLVARLGGEEFAVLLPGVSAPLCADIAERMRLAVQRLELPHSGLGPHGLVSVSAGVASHTISAATSAAQLFEAADSALYQAKISGRNRVCVATMETLGRLAATVEGA